MFLIGNEWYQSRNIVFLSRNILFSSVNIVFSNRDIVSELEYSAFEWKQIFDGI